MKCLLSFTAEFIFILLKLTAKILFKKKTVYCFITSPQINLHWIICAIFCFRGHDFVISHYHPGRQTATYGTQTQLTVTLNAPPVCSGVEGWGEGEGEMQASLPIIPRTAVTVLVGGRDSKFYNCRSS